jgi:hypothetical protein
MTVIPFTPQANGFPAFSALVTLDGQPYTLVTMWNAYRYDWYLSLTNQSGQLVINQPLIASPPGANIYLAPQLFTTSTLLFRESTNSFEVGP